MAGFDGSVMTALDVLNDINKLTKESFASFSKRPILDKGGAISGGRSCIDSTMRFIKAFPGVSGVILRDSM